MLLFNFDRKLLYSCNSGDHCTTRITNVVITARDWNGTCYTWIRLIVIACIKLAFYRNLLLNKLQGRNWHVACAIKRAIVLITEINLTVISWIVICDTEAWRTSGRGKVNTRKRTCQSNLIPKQKRLRPVNFNGWCIACKVNWQICKRVGPWFLWKP